MEKSCENAKLISSSSGFLSSFNSEDFVEMKDNITLRKPINLPEVKLNVRS